jgi:DNA-binding CsgD family transcriptional regulator
MAPRNSIYIVHSSPIIAQAIQDSLQTAGRSVNRCGYSWIQFISKWDFSAAVVILDAYLDDHVPLSLKVRALYDVGSTAVVIGEGDERLHHRAALEGCQRWLTPETDPADIAEQICAVADAERAPRPEPEVTGPRFTDRELQIMAAYTSRRAPTAKALARSLGISIDTARSHLRAGRRKYENAGIDVGSRARLQQALVDDGYIVDVDRWSALARW